MTRLQWTPDLDVGVASMNAEHQKLIQLMNRFAEVAESGGPKARAEQALGALAAYTVQHFQDEEAEMAKMGYPGLAQHQVVHKSLLQQLEGNAAAYKKSGDHKPLLMFLTVWLRAHIRGIDSRYGKHANGMAAR